MDTIRLTKIFDFETAHALHNYDGLCRNIHGHSYKLHVTVSGTALEDKESPKLGMLIDFGVLKQIVKKNIIDVFDHSLILSDEDKISDITKNSPLFKRIHLFNFQPTCEKMIVHFADILRNKLPYGVCLHSLRLYETANSYAEWFASDQ